MAQELLPRIFQADLDRLYARVIRPTLAGLPIHDDIRTGEVETINEFLDNAEKHTSNLLAFEARRSFALTLAGVFERQVRTWARTQVTAEHCVSVATQSVNKLVEDAAAQHTLDLETRRVGVTLRELHLLANAVRHGDGDSVSKLRQLAPQLWRFRSDAEAAIAEQRSILSEAIQPSDEDFVRYIRATTRFWGLADHEWGAVVDGPY